MKVLFVTPNLRAEKSYWPSCRNSHQPLEMLYSASVLKRDHTVKVHDLHAENLTVSDACETAAAFGPDVIVTSTVQSYLSWRCCPVSADGGVELVSALRKRRGALTRIILIGPHATVSPEYLDERCSPDFIIRGEPEIALTRLIRSGCADESIPGVWTRHRDNGITAVDDLKDLGIIDFSLCPVGAYHAHRGCAGRGAIVEASRGCLYSCEFCFNQAFRKRLRLRPVEQVMVELRDLVSRGCTYVYFIDELFNHGKPALRTLLNGISALRLSFGCQARPDIMTPELLDLFASSGCVGIEYGLESFDETIRKRLKKNADLAAVISTINNTVKRGIRTYAFLVYGLEQETPESLRLTRKMLSRLDPGVDFSGAPVALYPTLPIYADRFGPPAVIGRQEWENVGNASKNFMNPDTLMAETIRKTWWDRRLRRKGIPSGIATVLSDLFYECRKIGRMKSGGYAGVPKKRSG